MYFALPCWASVIKCNFYCAIASIKCSLRYCVNYYLFILPDRHLKRLFAVALHFTLAICQAGIHNRAKSVIATQCCAKYTPCCAVVASSWLQWFWFHRDNGLEYPMYCMCVCVCRWCNVAERQNRSSWFSLRDATEDSLRWRSRFAGGRGHLPRGGVLDLENFQLSAMATVAELLG